MIETISENKQSVNTIYSVASITDIYIPVDTSQNSIIYIAGTKITIFNTIHTLASSFIIKVKPIKDLRTNDTFILTGSDLKSIILRRLSNPHFVLKHPIELIIKTEGKGYLISNDNLNIHSLRKTRSEALEEWEQVLIDLYLSYHRTPDDQLTIDGKRFKDRLETTVTER